MKGILFIISAALSLILSQILRAQMVTDPSNYNVVWIATSDNSSGSIPFGNGESGLNVWVDRKGDFLFSRTTVKAFDPGHLLPRLRRIRIKTEPTHSAEKFKQTLRLMGDSISAGPGDVSFRILGLSNSGEIVKINVGWNISDTVPIKPDNLSKWKASIETGMAG